RIHRSTSHELPARCGENGQRRLMDETWTHCRFWKGCCSPIQRRVSMRIVSVARRAVHNFFADECSTRAAALAYYAGFSVPPALLIIIYIAGLKYGQSAAAGQISQLESFVGAPAASQIEAIISNAAQQKHGGLIASLIGLAALIYASTTAFAQL